MTEVINKTLVDTSKSIYSQYSHLLGYDDEKTDIVFDVVDSLETMMDRKRVREQAVHWDEVGVKLKDGKVVLPDGMQEITDEILKENQMVNLFLPEELGGLGLKNVHSGPMVELLAKYDFSLKILALSGVGLVSLLTRYYKPEFESAIKKFGSGDYIGYVSFSEPQAGSNLRAIKSTSELVGDEWVLNGTKMWISNGGIGNCGLFLANNIENGKPKGTNVFLVEGNDGITTLRLEKKSGLKASPTAQLLYENVTVPKENLIGELGLGYEKVLERLMGMRVAVGYQSLGACKRAYELAWDYANQREAFGKPIIEIPAVKRKLTWMERQIPKVEEVAYMAGFALDYSNQTEKLPTRTEGVDPKRREYGEDIKHGVDKGLIHYYVSGAKLYTPEVTNPMLYDACQVFGGMGFVAETEVNRISRDVRVLSIFDGTSEVHHFVLNRHKKILEGLPDHKRPLSYFDYDTVYDDFVYSKFPDLKETL